MYPLPDSNRRLLDSDSSALSTELKGLCRSMQAYLRMGRLVADMLCRFVGCQRLKSAYNLARTCDGLRSKVNKHRQGVHIIEK